MKRSVDFITMTMQELERIKVIEAVVRTSADDRGAPQSVSDCANARSAAWCSAIAIERSGRAGLWQARAAEQPRVARRSARPRAWRWCASAMPISARRWRARSCANVMACVLAKETVRRWMRMPGLWIPRKQRPPKLHQPRNRRACLGELIQIDGSDHRVVRGTGAGLHVAGVHRRRDQPPDDAALHGDRVDLQLFRGDARVPRAATASRWRSTATRPACSIATATAETAGKGVTQFGRAHVRAEHRHLVRQQQPGQGPRRAGQPDVAGPAGEGTAAARHRHEGGRQRLCAPLHRRLQRPLWRSRRRATFDAHRPLRADEILDLILTWRVPRQRDEGR